jgi:hypothetical protein
MLKSKLDYEEQQDLLIHRGYTDAEVREILDEATRLEAAAAGRTDSEMLLQSAEEAGISREFVEEAMRRWAARRQQQAFRTDSQGNRRRLFPWWGAIRLAVFIVPLLGLIFIDPLSFAVWFLSVMGFSVLVQVMITRAHRSWDGLPHKRPD